MERLCYSNCVKRKCENCVCRTRRYFHTYNTFSCSKNIILEEQMSACGNFSKKNEKKCYVNYCKLIYCEGDDDGNGYHSFSKVYLYI